jgi:hypothetical protein
LLLESTHYPPEERIGSSLVDDGCFPERDLPVALSANAGPDCCNTISLFGRSSEIGECQALSAASRLSRLSMGASARKSLDQKSDQYWIGTTQVEL